MDQSDEYQGKGPADGKAAKRTAGHVEHLMRVSNSRSIFIVWRGSTHLDDGLSIYHECYGRTSSDSTASGRLVHGPEWTVGRETPKTVERTGLLWNGNAQLRGGRGSFLMISVLR
ncbi:MAG: hypothetical protein VX189_00615, partial [Planctomycetota bacterium]|nr:hypothetical protein [Planctomycetota bacterium]